MNMDNDDYKRAKDYSKVVIANSKNILSGVGKPSPYFRGREDEVNAVVQSFMKKRMRNCILVGKAGAGKTEIIKKVAKMLQGKEVIIAMDVSELQAGCTLVGKFEEKLNAIIKPIAKFNNSSTVKITLFVDEIHSLWTVGKNEWVGTVSASNILKPYLSDGSITIIGATTTDEYNQYVRKDKALLRRLPPIIVGDLDESDLVKILIDFADGDITKEQAQKCVEISKTIDYLQNPDASLEILDRAMARAKFAKRVLSEEDFLEVAKLMKGDII